MQTQELVKAFIYRNIPYPTTTLLHRERLVSGFIASGTAVLQNFGEENQ